MRRRHRNCVAARTVNSWRLGGIFCFFIFTIFCIFGLLHFTLFCIFVLIAGAQFYFLFWTFVCFYIFTLLHILHFLNISIFAFLYFCTFLFCTFVLLYFYTLCTFVLCHLVGQTKYQCNFSYNIKAFRILLFQWHVKEKTCVHPTISGPTDYTPQVWVRQNPPPPRLSGMGYTSPIKKCVFDWYWKSSLIIWVKKSQIWDLW